MCINKSPSPQYPFYCYTLLLFVRSITCWVIQFSVNGKAPTIMSLFPVLFENEFISTPNVFGNHSCHSCYSNDRNMQKKRFPCVNESPRWKVTSVCQTLGLVHCVIQHKQSWLPAPEHNVWGVGSPCSSPALCSQAGLTSSLGEQDPCQPSWNGLSSLPAWVQGSEHGFWQEKQ